MTIPRLLQVSLCHNDDRGKFNGLLTRIEVEARVGGIYDIALTLETGSMRGLRISRGDNTLLFHRHYFEFAAKQEWAGNMAHTAYAMTAATLADLLNTARASRKWGLDSGWDSLWRHWASSEPFTAEQLERELLGDGDDWKETNQ